MVVVPCALGGEVVRWNGFGGSLYEIRPVEGRSLDKCHCSSTHTSPSARWPTLGGRFQGPLPVWPQESLKRQNGPMDHGVLHFKFVP